MVLFVMIDGLRPEAITAEGSPALTGLMARGAYSMTARSVMPCITLPCHMSIFHSVPPTRHGVTTNVWSPMARPLPGLMEAASTAVVVQADHGGHDCSHGTEAAEDMTIPWIAAGPGLRAGHALQGPVSLLDTAPTLARLMRVPPAADWEGKVVEEAFV